MARRSTDRETSSRRRADAQPRGRRVTSRGGMNVASDARDVVFPLVQQQAHQDQQNPIAASIGRFFNGQSPTGLRPTSDLGAGPGGRGDPRIMPGHGTNPHAVGWTNPELRDFNAHVGLGGPGAGPNPFRDINPGGLMQGGLNPNLPPWVQNHITGNPADDPNMHSGRGHQFLNPGGLMQPGPGQSRGPQPMPRQQFPTPPGTSHNHGGSSHDHPGGGPGHKHGDGGQGGPGLSPADARAQTQQALQNGGPNQPAFDPSQFQRGDARPYDPSQLLGNGSNAYTPDMTNQQVRAQFGPQGFGLNGQPNGGQVNPGGPNQPGGGAQGGGGRNIGPGDPRQGGGGQNQAPPPYVQNWAPAHPDAFARRFPTYADYTAGVQDPRRQAFYDSAMAAQQGTVNPGGPMQGGGGHTHGGQPHNHPGGDQPHGHGQGGAGGGGGGQGGQAGGGGQGGGAGGGGQAGGPWATQNPDGTWSYPSPDAHMPGTDFTPVPGAGTPMTSLPASRTDQPGGNYPWAGQGYQAPPGQMNWYNPGIGGFSGLTPQAAGTPVDWGTADQLYSQYGLQVGQGTPPNQVANPSGGTQPVWTYPAPQAPGVYDPYTESSLLGHAYKPTGGDYSGFSNAYTQAAGGSLDAYDRLALEQYLAHKAGYGQYGSLTGALPYGYVAGQ